MTGPGGAISVSAFETPEIGLPRSPCLSREALLRAAWSNAWQVRSEDTLSDTCGNRDWAGPRPGEGIVTGVLPS